MKMLRVVCALFWLGCGWCAGDAACQNTRRHLAALEKTLLLLQRVRQEINYRHTDLTLLFCRLKQEGLVTGLEAGPTKPVQPRVLRTTYQVSSFITILTRT